MPFQFNATILTERLSLIPATATHVLAELRGNSAFGDLVHAVVPASWPPGEYNRDAQQYFLNSLNEAGEAGVGWFGWYAVRHADQHVPATLVGCGGYFGPPSVTGVVEIGYSVCPEWHGQGYATEMTRALVAHVTQHAAVSRVVAHTHADNSASMAVLWRCGFAQEIISDQADAWLFAWAPAQADG